MAASHPVDGPNDPVYARLFFMAQILKLCVYLQCLYSPPVKVIFKENLVHCPSSLSTLV